jgi:hypothetical protein
MEIQALKLFITDADVAALAEQHLGAGEGIEDLQVRLTPDGVVLSGRYPTSFFNVTFETVWQVSAAGIEIRVELATVRVAGFPANMLRGAMMKTLSDRVESEPGVRVEGEAVIVNVPDLARGGGIDLLINFTEVRMSIGTAVIEAGRLP